MHQIERRDSLWIKLTVYFLYFYSEVAMIFFIDYYCSISVKYLRTLSITNFHQIMWMWFATYNVVFGLSMSLNVFVSYYDNFGNFNIDGRIILIWVFWIFKMGLKPPTASKKALHWKRLWIDIVINIVLKIVELVFCLMAFSLNLSRLLLRFVFANISKVLFHFNIS